MNVNNILTLLNVNSLAVVSFNVNAVPNGNGATETVINLANGGQLTYTSSVPVPEPVVENHTVAYFAYPSSDGGMPLNRRVIVQENVGGTTGWIRGWETSNDSDYQFKKFLKRRIPGYMYHIEEKYIAFRTEPVTSEDREHNAGVE